MDRWRHVAATALRTAVELTAVGHDHGEAMVWRVDDAAGRTRAFLKVHRVPHKWRRERTILERLAALPCPIPVPAVLAADAPGRALLLQALPGRPADERTGSAADRGALHEHAGRLRRALDSIAVDQPDPVPLPEAVERRFRAWSQRARGHLEPALVARAQRGFEPDRLEGIPRRWSHRDLTPSNWIVQTTSAGPRLGVIDFGQARPDAWLVDAVKLRCGAWVDEPHLAEAFWTGYGRRPTPHEHGALRQLSLLHGLATAAWGDQHGEPALSAHGRAVLDRELADLAD